MKQIEEGSLSDIALQLFIKRLKIIFTVATIICLPLFISMGYATYQYWFIRVGQLFTFKHLVCLGTLLIRQQLQSTNWYLKDLPIYTHIAVNLMIMVVLLQLHYQVKYIFQSKNDNRFERYCLQFSNLPQIDPQIIVPLLIKQIRLAIKQQSGYIDELEFIDVFPSYSKSQIKLRLNCKYLQQLRLKIDYQKKLNLDYSKLQKIKNKFIQQEHKLKIIGSSLLDNEIYAIWITFKTARTRDAVKYIMKNSNYNEFQGKSLQVNQAPSPSDLIWDNLYRSKSKVLIKQVIGYVLAIILLLSFDIAILKLRQSGLLSFFTPIVWVIMESFLVYLIKCIVYFQRANLRSNQQSSLLNKITILRFINMTFLVIVQPQSIQRPESMIKSFRRNWYLSVIYDLLISFSIKSVLISLNWHIDYLIDLAVKFYSVARHILVPLQQLKQFFSFFKNKLITSLDIGLSYAEFLGISMTAILFYYFAPVMMPIAAIGIYFGGKSFKFHLSYISNGSLLNERKFNVQAIQMLYCSSVLSLLLVAWIENSIQLGITAMFTLIIPFCQLIFSGLKEQTQTNDFSILDFMTFCQIKNKIKQLQNRIDLYHKQKTQGQIASSLRWIKSPLEKQLTKCIQAMGQFAGLGDGIIGGTSYDLNQISQRELKHWKKVKKRQSQLRNSTSKVPLDKN